MVVLAALTLVMLLMVALLQSTLFQARDSQNALVLAQEKMLADSAVALVIGQIQQASTQSNQCWISQPGLLRTYAISATRKPSTCYKLYSAAQMTDTSGTLNFLTNDTPSDWNSTANQNAYTDLNSPAVTSSRQTIYPILDPAATNSVTGVSVDGGHDVSMPVAWLYQLQDGTLGPASNGTKSNPIVARIAFWTDDETCKININTAGYGTGWNSPHLNSTDDVMWSTNQPASGLYSSYPGHPATTSLGIAFGTSSYSPQQLLGLTPRYAPDGSLKADRLYNSLDELCFSSSLTTDNQRQTNIITPGQIEVSRFVLTAHSQSPETTLLGEPRIAIWPVSDAPSDTTRTTATDRAVISDATIGSRSYYFQRHNALSATDDLDTNIVPSNAQLFNELLSRGNTLLPGYGTCFTQKYTGATWPQLMLEIADFIRGLNAIDPSPAPFVPYAKSDPATGLGRGFIVPLSWTYASGSGPVTLRGLGRCPTLSSLTLVFYVCGFGFKDGSVIDFTGMSNVDAVAKWNNYFLPGSSQWKNVSSELVRCFVVPCTFQPGCAYPEVNDDCDIQIQGLDQIKVTCGSNSGNFGFQATTTSPLLGYPLQVLKPDRAWGGNEGPVTWRATGDALANNQTVTYPFTGTNYLVVPMVANATASQLDPKTGGSTWPPINQPFSFAAVHGLTVLIRDGSGHALQTLALNLPAFTVSNHAPSINGECDHADDPNPANANTGWTNSATTVLPCYYMNLQNRLLATQNNRPLLIQPGDVTRTLEANDARVISALNSIPGATNTPSALFQSGANYISSASQSHNLSFADGTSVLGSFGPTRLVKNVQYSTATNSLICINWRDGKTPMTNFWYTVAPGSAPSTANGVTMAPVQVINGDWDTGPGLAPDGALINLPDAGTTLAPSTAYFSLSGGQTNAPTQRTPNALVPSPVVFGSLPAGVDPLNPVQSEPWRTLLFCPYPASATNSAPYNNGHPGAVSPPDHLILDNFWMPTVEPYPISSRMTTVGKINLNDQIAPFTWIHRNTALHALLTNLRIPAIPAPLPSITTLYKSPGSPIPSIWKPVDEDATIVQEENKFATNSVDAYLSESEICTVPLVPQGLNAASTNAADVQTALYTFWNNNYSAGHLTGDNLRELPYAELYSRLTTRSNSYTVHVRVQVLQKLAHDPNQNVWNEGTDLILGDWRGSYEIERYLDPAAPTPVLGQPLRSYKFRIVSARQFAP